MRNVFCVGEMLIDFICKDTGVTIAEGRNFEKNAGGAPANVAAAVAKLGGKSYFMGKVGDDSFGEYLENVLKEVQVDTSMLVKGNHTTFAFVSIDTYG
jgi:fructokinase